jgi:hypothetical protein
VFDISIYDFEEFKMNVSGTVQAHRVSRIPGGDFTFMWLWHSQNEDNCLAWLLFVHNRFARPFGNHPVPM